METEHIPSGCLHPAVSSRVVLSFVPAYYTGFFGNGLKWSIIVGSFFRTDHMCPHLLHR